MSARCSQGSFPDLDVRAAADRRPDCASTPLYASLSARRPPWPTSRSDESEESIEVSSQSANDPNPSSPPDALTRRQRIPPRLPRPPLVLRLNPLLHSRPRAPRRPQQTPGPSPRQRRLLRRGRPGRTIKAWRPMSRPARLGAPTLICASSYAHFAKGGIQSASAPGITSTAAHPHPPPGCAAALQHRRHEPASRAAQH